jgi:hypothetical protein
MRSFCLVWVFRNPDKGCDLGLLQGDDAGEVEDDFDRWKERVWARLKGEDLDESAAPKKEADIESLGPVPEIPITMHDVCR